MEIGKVPVLIGEKHPLLVMKSSTMGKEPMLIFFKSECLNFIFKWMLKINNQFGRKNPAKKIHS